VFVLSERLFWKRPVKKQSKIAPIVNFLRGESGATSVEYAVMLALIIAICIVAIRALGDNQSGMWGGNLNKLDAAGFVTP